MPSGQDLRAGATSDEELVRRLRADDDPAAEELMARYRDPLVRYCRCYLDRIEDAEDATQEVLHRLASPSSGPEGAIRPWLYRVARNLCLDWLKRRTDGRVGAGSAVGGSRMPSRRTGPRTALLRNERWERLRQLVADMSDPYREVVLLRYFGQLRPNEVADILKIPASLVYSRLFEAREQLRRQLQSTEGSS